MESLTKPTFSTAPLTSTAPGAWGLVAVWVAAFVALLPFVFTSRFGQDEFQFLYEAKQIAQGAVMYQDFFDFIMPGSFLLLGAWFKLVGPSLLAARLLQAAVLAALAALAWRLARSLGAGQSLALVAPLLLVTVLVPRAFAFSHHWFAQAGVGLALGLTWWALGRRNDAPWAVVGLAVGLTYACQQLDGAALLAGLGAGALWTAWRQRWGWGHTARRAGLFLAGAVAPLVLLMAYFAWRGALPEALWATHVWPLTQYRAAGNHNDVAFAMDLAGELSTQAGWVSRTHWYASLIVAMAGTFVPPTVALAGLAWLAGLGRTALADDRRTAMAGVLAFVAAVMFLAACRGRADLTHLMYMALPAMLLAVTGVAAWERAVKPWEAGRGLRWLPRMPLVALVLAGVIQVAEVARRTPEAWARLESPDRRIVETPALQAIAKALAPGDTLFTGPIGAVAYFYLAPNATRYSYWVRPEDGYTTPSQHAEILEAVRRKRPRLLVVTTQGGRGSADRYVAELLDHYTFDQTQPYPSWEPRAPFQVYLYRLHEPPASEGEPDEP